jgi:DNA-binding transcriptional LysR family regulator
MPCVELRQGRFVETVAWLESFALAGEVLRVPVDVVERQVRALERELGLPLFDRSRRSVRLTAHGRRFLDEVLPAIDDLDAACGALRRAARSEGSVVAVGMGPLVDAAEVSRALTAFRSEEPEVSVGLTTGTVDELVAALLSGELDVVLGCVHPDGVPEGLAVQEVRPDELVLVVGPATARRVERLEDAADESFVSVLGSAELGRHLELAAATHGVEPVVAFEVTSVAAARELVAADLAVAVLPRSVLGGSGPEVWVRSLDRAPAPPPLCVVTATQPPPSAPACRLADLLVAAD